jgi:putative nucleotidyltransferase with HDIG domain
MRRILKPRAQRRREARAELTPAARVRRQRLHLWAAMGVLALALWGVFLIVPPTVPGLQPGLPSPVTIQAPRTLKYESALRTEQERSRAESDPANIVYRDDPNILIGQRAQLSELLQSITQIRQDPTLDRAAKQARLATLPDSTLAISPTLATRLIRLNDDQWQVVSRGALDLYDRAVRENNYVISDQDLANLRRTSLPYWASLYERGEPRELILLFANAFLKANRVVDEQATAQRRQQARAAVAPVTVTILEGENIVREGDVITPAVEEKLEALGLLRVEPKWWLLGGEGLLAALLAALFGAYLMQCQRQVWMSDRPLLVVCGLFALTVLAARFVLPLTNGWQYLFPLAATAILIAALFNAEIALVAATLLSVAVAFIGDRQFGLGATLLFGSMAGVFVIGRPQRSLTFLLAGLAVAMTTALTETAFGLMSALEPRPEQILPILLFSGVNGALSAIVALGLYNLAGQIAGIVTPFQLMEWGHPAQPLLRKLMREAPGTYYHSIAVGNLAESAAEAIGADALLLRVAAYYHDVGKVLRPYFYTDNQSDRENVHNELDPQTSARIIADHVREGMQMAREAGLPKQIVDFIPTHHGTTTIRHFYQLALQQHDSVDPADFRYPGPRPQTKEQAILMLADTVEATVRSKAQHGQILSARDNLPNGNGRGASGKQTLEELVHAIIDERVRSGELDDSTLTLSDLARIRQAFITTLQGIYHPRVEYTPEVVKPVESGR